MRFVVSPRRRLLHGAAIDMDRAQSVPMLMSN
jgi:hypothetical protein